MSLFPSKTAMQWLILSVRLHPGRWVGKQEQLCYFHYCTQVCVKSVLHNCVNADKETCQEIPKKECNIMPEKKCHKVTKKVPRKIQMTVCDQCPHCSEAEFTYSQVRN